MEGEGPGQALPESSSPASRGWAEAPGGLSQDLWSLEKGQAAGPPGPGRKPGQWNPLRLDVAQRGSYFPWR